MVLLLDLVLGVRWDILVIGRPITGLLVVRAFFQRQVSDVNRGEVDRACVPVVGGSVVVHHGAFVQRARFFGKGENRLPVSYGDRSWDQPNLLKVGRCLHGIRVQDEGGAEVRREELGT